MAARSTLSVDRTALAAPPPIVRPVRVDDAPALTALVQRSYRGPAVQDPSYIEQLMHRARIGDALVVIEDDRLVAAASFARLECDPQVAVVSWLVEAGCEADRLGALALRDLAGIARSQGLRAFVAEVAKGDLPLPPAFADNGLIARTEILAGGLTEVYVDLTEAGPRTT